MEFLTNIFYLLRVKPKQESICEQNLKNQSAKFYLPRFMTGKRKGSPIFSGYVFVKVKDRDSFQAIRSTKGITDYVRFNTTFATATDNTIKDIQRTIESLEAKFDKLNKYQTGQEVLVKSGPFKDFNAVFESYDKNESVFILLNFLRFKQSIKLNIDHLD